MWSIKPWLKAFRLQTLPLAFSCIFIGAFLAIQHDSFKPIVFALALLTTLCLQILSNLANDLGDAQKGTDNKNRLGPERTVQAGIISLKAMKNAVVLFAILSLGSGVCLLWVSFQKLNFLIFFFLLLGLASIAAAIKYTVGKSAYGYRAMGDLFVFLFFGWVGVAGSYFLYDQYFNFAVLLPASTIGLFSVGVLNLNNLRDIENDRAFGKNTIAVVLGKQKTAYYHVTVLVAGWSMFVLYCIFYGNFFNFLVLLTLPIFIKSMVSAIHHKAPQELIPELKRLAVATFLFSIVALGSQILFNAFG